MTVILPEEARAAAAARAREAHDVALPRLCYWNYNPCVEHSTIVHGCRKCGVEFKRHQRVAITWSYLAKKVLIADSMGLGKCLKNSARVLTPKGWRAIGSLIVGEEVSSPFGGTQKVTGVYPQGIQQLFKVSFSDGKSIECSEDHLWYVRGPKRNKDAPKYRTLPLKIIRASVKDKYGNSRYFIPQTAAVEFEEKPWDLFIDPYLLGLLLGDGSIIRDCPRFSTADPELIAAIKRVLPEGVIIRFNSKYDWVIVPSAGQSGGRYHNTVTAALKELCLWGTSSESKFIPDRYKFASIESRTALLQGLMDTDGSVTEIDGHLEYTTVSPRLAEDFQSIIESLGGTAPTAKGTAFYTYKDARLQGKDRYRVSVRLPKEIIPFRLERKLAVYRPLNKYLPVRAIRAVEPTVEEEATCISVDEGLYITEHCIVTHNTIEAAGLIAILKERGELTNRAIVVVRPSVLVQWRDELSRVMPRLAVEIAVGTRGQRIERYCSNADVILIGYQMLLRDIEMVVRLEPSLMIVDDVDPARNNTKTKTAIGRIARDLERVVIMSGTPVQVRLLELYNLLELIGGRQTFGSQSAFETRYIRKEPITIYRRAKKITVKRVIGYKNLNEFRELLQPYYMRRTYCDLDGSDLPGVMTEDVWLDLYEPQRAKYEELQEGVLRIIREEGEQVKQATAMGKFLYGSQICAGLATLGEPDGPQASVKLDWLMDKLSGDLYQEKVVVFSQFKNTIRAIHARLEEAGIGYATTWGDESNPRIRAAEQQRFWTDRYCRVMIGTAAMEQGLNLQISNILINIDMMLNPARMHQLTGRIRRLGSTHAHVWVFNLLTTDTQEARYLPVLESRQALADYVWSETNDLFQQLSPLALLQLLQP